MQSLVQTRRELAKEHLAVQHLVNVTNCPGCEYRKDYEVYVTTLGTFGTKVQYIKITDDRN